MPSAAYVDRDMTNYLDLESAFARPNTPPGLNNFYEFLPGQGGDVWPRTKDFAIEPWTVEIAGE